MLKNFPRTYFMWFKVFKWFGQSIYFDTKTLSILGTNKHLRFWSQCNQSRRNISINYSPLWITLIVYLFCDSIGIQSFVVLNKYSHASKVRSEQQTDAWKSLSYNAFRSTLCIADINSTTLFSFPLSLSLYAFSFNWDCVEGIAFSYVCVVLLFVCNGYFIPLLTGLFFVSVWQLMKIASISSKFSCGTTQ